MEIEELTLDEARLEICRLRMDCAEAYQVVGCLAGDFFNDDAVIKAMDNLLAAANGDPRPHEDLLPFELSQPVSTSHKKNNMKIEEYSELALRTASGKDQLMHAILGLSDESGELIGPLKKHLFYGKPLDYTNLKEEAGDLAWFLNLLIHALGTSWESVLEANIAKLEKRYPDLRFNADHAIHRDTAAEKAAMEVA